MHGERLKDNDGGKGDIAGEHNRHRTHSMPSGIIVPTVKLPLRMTLTVRGNRSL